MTDIFDILDDGLSLDFGRPLALRFNTAKTKDMLPSYWTRWTEDDGKTFKGYRCIVRALGVDEADIKIVCGNNSITVKGETEYEGQKYSQYVELPVPGEIMASVKRIAYKARNGMIYVYMAVETPKHEQIPIEKA